MFMCLFEGRNERVYQHGGWVVIGDASGITEYIVGKHQSCLSSAPPLLNTTLP